MKKTFTNPAVWAAISSVVFYWGARLLIGDSVMTNLVSTIGLILVFVLVVRWTPNAVDAFVSGAREAYRQQQIGIFVVFFFLVLQRILSLALAYFGRPDWLVQSGFGGFIVYGIVMGVVLYLYATRAHDGLPMRMWVGITIAVAVLSVIAGLVFGSVFQ